MARAQDNLEIMKRLNSIFGHVHGQLRPQEVVSGAPKLPARLPGHSVDAPQPSPKLCKTYVLRTPSVRT